MTHYLFAYGTLMDEDILHRVSGHRFKGEPAVVDGYRRHAILQAPYPAIVAVEGHSVAGVLYRAVPRTAWKRLDDFEGRMYQRQSVMLVRPVLSVNIYVLRPAFHHLLAQHDWDYDEFVRQHKKEYLAR